MKALKYISLFVLILTTSTSCMNDFDAPEFTNPPFGNNEIGEANTTIAQLKEKYSLYIQGNSCEEVTDSIIIEGVVVANDVTGNIYKQFVINDTTGAIIIGVNDVGLYATMAIGQRVRIDCKGLHIGGYGKLAQIGGLYNSGIGRMNKSVFPKHVRIIGKPERNCIEMVPDTIKDESYFTNDNMKSLAKYVRLENVRITEAVDSTVTWAPEELASSNVVERNIKIGKKNIVLRMSTYADFANEVLPNGELNMNGVMTRYNNYWQFMISSTNDIEVIKE